MKTDNMFCEFNLTTLRMVYKSLFCIGQNTQPFSVTLDNVEIVSKTTELVRFTEFLQYELQHCNEMIIRIYDDEGGIVRTYQFSLIGHGADMFFFDERERLQTEVKRLEKEVRKLRRKNRVEKPEDIKVLDGGDSFLIFLPKDKAEEVMNQHLARLKYEAKPFEVAMRYLKRFFPKHNTKNNGTKS